MKITLHLEKTFTIDLDDTKNSETKAFLLEKVSENEEGTTEDVVLDHGNISEAVEDILDGDIKGLIDLDLDSSNFTITVTD